MGGLDYRSRQQATAKPANQSEYGLNMAYAINWDRAFEDAKNNGISDDTLNQVNTILNDDAKGVTEADRKARIGDVVQDELLNRARMQMQSQGTGLSGNSRGVGFAGQTNSTPTSLLERGRRA